MSTEHIALAAAAALMLAGPAVAQVGGGSIGGSGTVGGGSAVGGAQIGGSGSAGSTVSPGNQNPAPGAPVLPNDPGLSGGAARSFSVPGSSDPAADNGPNTGVDRTPTAATTSPESIIDQPVAPNIPSPDQPGGDPATINLQDSGLDQGGAGVPPAQ